VPSSLATLNAVLNASASVCLIAGYVFIRRRQRERHRKSMIAAFALSVAFLIGYVVHHAQVGSVPFRGHGWVRPVYFAILIPHVSLAAPVVPLSLVTLIRGLRGRFDKHKRIARWTLPIWLYVSASGVVVYLMLYHWPV
jgi:putative membrane protein